MVSPPVDPLAEIPGPHAGKAARGHARRPRPRQGVRLLGTVLACAVMLAATGGRTHGSVWVPANPGGGGAFSCAGAGPTGIIVVCSDLSGAYRSLDGGQTWDVIGFSRGLSSTHVSALAFDPQDGSILYLGTDAGLFRSDDGGDTVVPVLAGGYVTAIAVADADPSIVYAMVQDSWNAARGRIHRSLDRGLTWAPVSIDLRGRVRVTTLVVDPHQPATVYLVTGRDWFAGRPARLYRSTDGGVRWQRIGQRLRNVVDVVADPTIPGTVWATSRRNLPGGRWTGWVWRSLDGGTSWTAIAPYSGAVRAARNRPGVVRVVDPDREAWEPESGVWQTLDNGQTWSRRGIPADWDPGWQEPAWTFERGHGVPKTIGTSLADADTLFWVDGQFAFASRDGGRLFTPLFTDPVSPGWWRGRGLDNTNLMAIAVNAAAPQQVFAGYFDLGCQRSLDGGSSWQGCNHPAFTGDWQGFGGNTTTVVTDPERAGVVWLTQGSSVDPPDMTLLRSAAAGERTSWAVANEGLPSGYVMGLSLDRTSPVASRTLFVTSRGDVYRSTNDGLSWSRVLACGGCRVTAVEHGDGSVVFAGGEAGLFRSLSGGAAGTWTRVGPPDFVRGPRPERYWDESWEGVSAIHPDPAFPGRVWVAAFGPGLGLYRSDDRGTSWLKVRGDDYQRGVAVDPANPLLVYAAASSAFTAGGAPVSSGVVRSTDGGSTWAPVNEGLPWPFAVAVLVDPAATRTVWIAAPGSGLRRRTF